MARAKRIHIPGFQGIDLRTPRFHLEPGYSQAELNGDIRHTPAWRIRPGYARFAQGDQVPTLSNIETDNFEDMSPGDALQDEAEWTSQGNGTEGNIKAVAGVRIDNTEAATATLPDDYGVLKYTGASFTDDHFAECKFIQRDAIPYNAHAGPAVRINANGCYVLWLHANGAIIYEMPFDGSNVVGVGVYFSTGAAPSGSTGRLEARGSLLRAYINDALVLEAVDATHTSGVPGLSNYQSGIGNKAELDDFRVGDVALSSAPVVVSDLPHRLFSFERDDNASRVLVGYTAGVDVFAAGGAEWIE